MSSDRWLIPGALGFLALAVAFAAVMLVWPGGTGTGVPAAGGPSAAFQQLLQGLQTLAAQPTGVGLDVPHWLRRLEWEAHRVRASRTAIAGLSQSLIRLPRTTLTLDSLRQQVQDWDQPLGDDAAR